jgi:hypothetical protein
MEASYSQYSSHKIQQILNEYKKGVRGHGFQALASKYQIKGGPKLVKYWYSKWDGTENSLKKKSGGDRRSILTEKQKKRYISDFVTQTSKKEAVIYSEVKNHVQKKTGKDPSLPTVQRYGKALKISSKKRKRVTKSQGFISILFSFCVDYRILSHALSVLCGRDDKLSRYCRCVQKKVSKCRKKSFGFY